jgi:GNAT superfamily N-acetyltransferase
MHAGMSPNVRRLTILGSPLLHHYVARQLESPAGDPYFVATVAHRVAGVASWRRMGPTLVLNHLYVAAESRGLGLGRALLAEGLRCLVADDVETLAVDVFSESQLARAWYAKLGLAPLYRCTWIETPLPPPRSMSDGQCTIEGMEQADREHAEQGFSQFKLHTFTAEYTVGRLGDEVFRIAGWGGFRDRPALAGLAALDARRVLISVGAPEDLPPDALRRSRIVAESERRAAPARSLRASTCR